MNERRCGLSGCYDCGLSYTDDGFQDLVIPNDAWLAISPTGHGGGLLCAVCICRRLKAKGVKCYGAFMSGPVETVHPSTMHSLRWTENLRETVYGRENVYGEGGEP